MNFGNLLFWRLPKFKGRPLFQKFLVRGLKSKNNLLAIVILMNSAIVCLICDVALQPWAAMPSSGSQNFGVWSDLGLGQAPFSSTENSKICEHFPFQNTQIKNSRAFPLSEHQNQNSLAFPLSEHTNQTEWWQSRRVTKSRGDKVEGGQSRQYVCCLSITRI